LPIFFRELEFGDARFGEAVVVGRFGFPACDLKQSLSPLRLDNGQIDGFILFS
jgi:hypothetical protein